MWVGGPNYVSPDNGYGIAYYPAGSGWTGDYSVEARIKFQAGAYGGGIGGRLVDLDPSSPAYGARYGLWVYPEDSPSGTPLTLGLVKFTDWGNWSGQFLQSASLTSVGTGWHTVKLVFQGSQIQAYFDGVLQFTVTDQQDAYLSGGVSLDMWNETPGSAYTMSVDYVTVHP